jgi:hypothetical protein
VYKLMQAYQTGEAREGRTELEGSTTDMNI